VQICCEVEKLQASQQIGAAWQLGAAYIGAVFRAALMTEDEHQFRKRGN
jgi:hypothetical protein